MKLFALLLLGEGWSYATVAKTMHRTERTLRTWSRTAKRHGIEALREASRSGRPSKLPPDVVAEINRTTQANPKGIGKSATQWTGTMLARWIKRQWGISIGVRSAQAMIRKRK